MFCINFIDTTTLEKDEVVFDFLMKRMAPIKECSTEYKNLKLL